MAHASLLSALDALEIKNLPAEWVDAAWSHSLVDFEGGALNGESTKNNRQKNYETRLELRQREEGRDEGWRRGPTVLSLALLLPETAREESAV